MNATRPSARKFLLVALLASFLTVSFGFSSLVSAQSGANWKDRWDKTVAAAKKEGKVVVFGPPGQLVRDGIIQGFKKAFPEISLELNGATERDHGTKIVAERNGGVYSVDVVVSGPSVALGFLKPIRALEPLLPALILPDITNPKNWRDGKLHFADNEERYNLVFVGQISGVLAYDPKQVKPEEIDEHTKLLDPKWKGKIIVNNPMLPGPGQAFFRFLWAVLGPEKGADYYRKLRAQAGVVDRDWRRQLEWVAQGRHPIATAPASVHVAALRESGVNITILPEFKDIGVWFSPSAGSVALLNRAPHPNAAVVFINWLLSKEGQSAVIEGLGAFSRRVDVPTDKLPSYMLPRPGGKYFYIYLESTRNRTEEEEKVIKEVYSN